jgi:2-oxoglutarate ferredoxin oxidoreductase subunit beta
MPIDIAWEALVGGATFVARSFAGDPKQVKELIKAALGHKGIAVLDIISPCVTFNNQDEAFHSYSWGREHEIALHDLSYVPPAEEIMVEYRAGEDLEVSLHDGSTIMLKKLGRDFDPSDRAESIQVLEEANSCNCLLTGLIYVNPSKPELTELYNLVDEPLNRLKDADLRPAPETIDRVNGMMF